MGRMDHRSCSSIRHRWPGRHSGHPRTRLPREDRRGFRLDESPHNVARRGRRFRPGLSAEDRLPGRLPRLRPRRFDKGLEGLGHRSPPSRLVSRRTLAAGFFAGDPLESRSESEASRAKESRRSMHLSKWKRNHFSCHAVAILVLAKRTCDSNSRWPVVRRCGAEVSGLRRSNLRQDDPLL